MCGAWCTADGAIIDITKIVQAAVDGGIKKQLVIYSDSCRAGNLAKESRRLCEEGKAPFD